MRGLGGMGPVNVRQPRRAAGTAGGGGERAGRSAMHGLAWENPLGAEGQRGGPGSPSHSPPATSRF